MKHKSITIPQMILIVIITIAITGITVLAATGTTDAANAPGLTSSYTLEDIYQRLNSGSTGSQISFTEPLVAPGTGSMHDLNNIMAAAPQQDNTNGALSNQVLSGKTFWGLTNGEWGEQTGSLSSGSDVTGTDGQLTFNIPDGYYSSNTATAFDSNLLPDNISDGVTIFGITGNHKSGWNLHTTTAQGANINGVYILSKTDGWAVGNDGRFYRWNGANWNLAQTIPSYDIFDIEMFSNTDGWAAGTNRIYHWNGSLWTTQAEILGVTFQKIDMVNSTDGWAVGSGGSFYHLDGSAWSLYSPSPTTSTIYGLYMMNSNLGWAGSYNGYIYTYDGSTWTQTTNVSSVIYDIDMLNSSYGWVTGNGGRIFQFTPNSTMNVHTISGYSGPVNAVKTLSTTDAWAVGDNGYIFHWDGTDWSTHTITTEGSNLDDLFMLDNSDGRAVGTNGRIYDYD